ncbi:metallophosphoesterase [Dysgonomonas sp. Marseille-P4677]|uniref:metallophosphoesterase n=1 Tax=Dysgonomonas sp. Marseille-P4677 TaxID=2364790 RepID=UPI001914D425|nr:metallophosphoesterase [Dysgonomonas sp. Marseille-P4677]MBK5720905.1 metallophosphoesterase [Dysgonomonas sp. Marseille-P4677]
MKTKLILLIIFVIGGIFSANAQHRADQQKLTDPGSFSMILMGDPQGYVKYDINQPLLELCTAWIADNIDNLNIKATLCTGDLVEQNENIVLNRAMLNQTSKEMWEASSRAFERLDNKVPYIVSCGNHDYGFKHAENGITNFPDYFPFERNSTWRNICISAYPNRNNRASIENAAFEFKDPNWGDILVITSEFHPRDEVLTWALELISKEKYINHKVIFMTHGYLTNGPKAKLIEKDNYSITPGNAGKDIWDKLIYPSSNIKLVICGHTGNGNQKFEDNVSYITAKNANGKVVSQMMFNVQTLGGGWEGNGGDGWLRILEFLPDGKTIKIRTYSPLFGISPSTKHLANRTEAFDQFDIVLE